MEISLKNISGDKNNQKSIINKIEDSNAIQNDKKELSETKDNELKLLYQSFMDTFSQKQYKKIYKEITLEPEKISNFDEHDFKFFHLKTVTLQKIISIKYSHYYNKPQKFQNLFDLFQDENNFINNWLKYIKKLPNNNKRKHTFIELIITFLLQKCLIRARFCIRENNLRDAVAFLSLAEKLIEKTCSFFTSPDIFHLASNIYLHLSSFLIAQNNFITAQFYIAHLIKYAFIDLELRLTNIRQIKTIYNLLELNNFEYEKILEIFNIISIGFYHLGICYENQDDNYMALQVYKQSKWFAKIIKENKNYENFYNMLFELNKRELMRNQLLIFFDRLQKENAVNKPKKNNIIKLQHPKFFDIDKIKKLKYMKLIEFIKNMKFIEADDDEPSLFNNINSKPLSETVKNSTKNIKLLNYLLSTDFKEFVNGLKKLEINKLNKDTASQIQKKIIQIKKEKEAIINLKMNNINKGVNNSTPKNSVNQTKLKIKTDIDSKSNNHSNHRVTKSYISFNNYNDFNIFDKLKQSSKTLKSSNLNNYPKSLNKFKLAKNNSPKASSKQISLLDRNSAKHKYNKNLYNITINNSNNKSITNNKYSLINTFSLKNRSLTKTEYPSIKKIIPKYIYNKYYSSKKYNKKRQILEKQYEREIKFQRQHLKSKFSIYEEGKIPQFNIRECYKQSQEFYENTLEFELMNDDDDEIEDFKPKNEYKSKNKLKTQNLGEVKPIELKPKFVDVNKKLYYKNEKEISNINQKSIDQISNYINNLNTDIDKIIMKKHCNVSVKNNRRKKYI